MSERLSVNFLQYFDNILPLYPDALKIDFAS